MNRGIIILSILFVLSAPFAAANLGDTPDALIARHGRPTNIDTISERSSLMYFKKVGRSVLANILDGHCVGELHQRDSGEVTANELQHILDDNAGGFTWRKNLVGELWIRSDDRLFALCQEKGIYIYRKPEQNEWRTLQAKRDAERLNLRKP